jgi:hypothetical protein
MFHEGQTLLIFKSTWVHPRLVLVESFLVFCVEFFLCACLQSVSCPVFYPCLWIDHSFDCLLCVLSRILPVFLDWPFFWLPALCLVPYSTRVSGLTILLIASSVSCPVFYSCLSGLTIRLIASSVFSNIYLTNNHYQRTIFLLWVIQENILPESAIEKQDLTVCTCIYLSWVITLSQSIK